MRILVARLRRLWGSIPRRRRLVFVVTMLVLAWTVAAALHQALWSWRYWRVDPWSEHSPVQWTATSHHVASLGSQVRRALSYSGMPTPGIGTSGAPDSESHRPISSESGRAVLAVSPDPGLAEQGFYQYLWVAYLLPDWDVRRVSRPEEALAADYWLVFGSGEETVGPVLGALPVEEQPELLTTQKSAPLSPLRLYRVKPDGSHAATESSSTEAP